MSRNYPGTINPRCRECYYDNNCPVKDYHISELDEGGCEDYKKGDKGEISDGYHTFNELYEHRNVLFITLCRTIYGYINETSDDIKRWRSKKHHDGSMFEGWFIMGMTIGHNMENDVYVGDKYEQISYHLPLKYWDMTNFAETLEKAPEWDGHTSDDVIERLLKL